ncbi:hypothetical protein Hanom_Chr12g01120391 [Helianthus anomalus]
MASLTLSLPRIKTYQQYHRHPTLILSPPFPVTLLPSPPNSRLNPPPHPSHALLLAVGLSPRAAVETLVLFSGHGCEVEDLQIEWPVVVVKNPYLQILNPSG